MKKSIFFGSLLMVAFSPAYLFAQEIKLPTVEIRVSQDKVPAQVKEAILNDFGEGHKPIAWVTNNSQFDTYAWEQSTNIENVDVFNYAIHTKTTAGSTLDAVYTSDGKRINSKEHLINFKPGLNIMLALQNTEFKDWGVKKSLHSIKVSSSGSEKERYALIMKKGNAKKTVYLDSNGRMLANLEGEHLELADANW